MPSTAINISGSEHLALSLRMEHGDAMGLFTSYFDESDTDAAAVVAGVVISMEQIARFDDEWKELLSRESVTCLHMKEFAHFKGDFEHGWRDNPKRRANFLCRAIGIISRRCNISKGITIDRKSFKKLNANQTRLFGNEYTAASIFAIMRTGLWADKYSHNRVNFVFDVGNENRASFEAGYFNLYQNSEFRESYHLVLLGHKMSS